MLLFDENLSRKLPLLLEEHFEDCKHVFDLNLQRTDDIEVWRISKEKGFTILSKDSDFHNLLISHGYPPKLIWLRTGNISTKQIASILLSLKAEIKYFIGNKDQGLLEIYQ